MAEAMQLEMIANAIEIELGRNEPKKRAGLHRPLVVETYDAPLWQVVNGAKRVERGRTSVVAGGRVDVVLEGKRQGLACARGDRSLGGRARERKADKVATAS